MPASNTPYLTKEEIARWKPYPLPEGGGRDALAHARERVRAAGQWAPWQMLGRRMAIGCVALEITQRCNLDCAYCYLSESSQALKDIPLEEVFRRIDLILAHYGPNTDIQVTGGEPALRQRDELVAIVAYIKRRGMRSSLFTNGIRASRALLDELCEAGLEDVAFHVDMSQGRKGYASETQLHALREAYIERARGLPLAVMFNNTIFPGNFHELAELTRFFVRHSDVVRMASFQIGADAGRGTQRARVAVDPKTVIQEIRAGAGANLRFDTMSAGHERCNRYAFGLVINGKVHDFLADARFVQQTLAQSAYLTLSRANKKALWRSIAGHLLGRPATLLGVASRLAALLWRERRHVVAARGALRKISFFVHNFMDSAQLERERCEACSFMAMTADGPVSMCLHNAKRDDYLLVPAAVQRAHKLMFFNPASGALEDRIPERISVAVSRANARGRARATGERTLAAPVTMEIKR
jgi:7,8-dihydro-6-hydroxymethylpterin dimethyltransferase